MEMLNNSSNNSNKRLPTTNHSHPTCSSQVSTKQLIIPRLVNLMTPADDILCMHTYLHLRLVASHDAWVIPDRSDVYATDSIATVVFFLSLWVYDVMMIHNSGGGMYNPYTGQPATVVPAHVAHQMYMQQHQQQQQHYAMQQHDPHMMHQQQQVMTGVLITNCIVITA